MDDRYALADSCTLLSNDGLVASALLSSAVSLSMDELFEFKVEAIYRDLEVIGLDQVEKITWFKQRKKCMRAGWSKSRNK